METYGKIFVVVAVLALILVGIFVYLFFIDRKIGKLEKEINEKESHKQQ
ncbi:MAG: CcmD family protein [Bacteroidetes bacterium]|nr:CcmD family protein [Bacteroidota bacterium]